MIFCFKYNKKMIKIPEAVESIVRASPFFEFGISHRLINLSQLAKFIQQLLETRTKKPVKVSTVVMALSRLQKQMNKILPSPENFKIENIDLHSHLSSLTFFKNATTHKEIGDFYGLIQEESGFATLTEGMTEITIIFEGSRLEKAKQVIRSEAKKSYRELTAVGIKFDAATAQVPGFLYSILQQTTLQHINIVEVASTYTEFMLYVEAKDAKLTFDTLFNCFMNSSEF